MNIEIGERCLERRSNYLKTQAKYYECVQDDSTTALDMQEKRRAYHKAAERFAIAMDTAIEVEEICSTNPTT